MTEKQLKWQKRSSLGKLSPQDDTRYSIEYKDSIVPLQESTDEDATTATYKKTYKFIGTW